MQPKLVGALKTGRSIAGLLVIVALSLYVYDFLKKADRETAMDEAAVIREQTRALQAQASEVNQQLQNANAAAIELKSEVATQRAAMEADKTRQIRARYLAEGLQIAQAARVAIAETYQTSLQWPTSNADAGLPAPERMKGDSLQGLQIGGGGVITLTYDEKSGAAGGTIRLLPMAHGGAVRWDCVTASYADIADVIPQCIYAPGK